MPTRNIELSTYEEEFIALQIESGQYQNASEVLHAGLSLLKEKTQEIQKKTEILKQEIKKGIDDYDQGRYLSVQNHSEHKKLMAQIEHEVELEFLNEKP